MTTIALGSRISAGSFNYFATDTSQPVIKYIYPKDINGDGVDEIVFIGFKCPCNSPDSHPNTSVHIFGWQSGDLKEITSQWLPGKTNIVESVGDVAFGDFNGDGKTDLYLSAYTDMNYAVNAYELINRGDHFEKINLGLHLWEHSVAAYDINKDGYSDVVPIGYFHPGPIYFGSSSGLSGSLIKDFNGNNSWDTNGSGVAIGDFFGDGSTSLIVVDAGAHNGKTILLKVDPSNPEIFTYISTLPDPILDNIKYGIPRDSGGNSHDVRARALDFSHDGLMDVIVFSRMTWDGSKWPEISAVQFLKNIGKGVFEDVTETVLVGYTHKNSIGYNPIIADFNNDGLEDIFIGESDYSASNSTVLLMQKPNGTFVETARSQLSALTPTGNNLSNIAKGPEGNYYVISQISASNNGLNSIYANKITFIENRAPTLIKSLADVNVNEGKAISFSLSTAFKDPDNADVLTYSVSLEDGAALPNWLSFNTVTKNLVGTLPYSTDTNILVKVTATDNDGLSVSDVFSINVSNVSNINGTNGSNIIVAGIGNDTINGGLGNDTLTGGLGNDTFVFNTKLGPTNIDTISDFASGDKIALVGSIFSKLKGDKDLSDNLYVQTIVGISTQDANDYLFYDFESGGLYYDADGSGAKAAVQIAIIGTGGVSLTANDFSIV